MDKAEFLKELKTYLAVLNESEQKDILDEYAQHIDMKMEKGMSEAEAIRDFGAIRELAAEILEAYHVNPGFGTGKQEKAVNMGAAPNRRMAEARTRLRANGGRVFAQLYRCLMFCLTGLRTLIAAPFLFVKHIWDAGKERRQGNRKEELQAKQQGEQQMMDGDKLQQVNGWKQLPNRTIRAVKRMTAAIAVMIIWCFRWLWNACMLLVVIIAGAMMLGCLYLFGILVVLLMQGYPLVGLVIGCLGAILCTGALTLFAVGLMRRRKTTGDGEVQEQHDMQLQEAALWDNQKMYEIQEVTRDA